MIDHRHQVVNQAHADWSVANQELRAREKLLSHALELYAQGRTPLPVDMIEEVAEMRRGCNALFKQLMLAMQVRIDSRDSQ